MLWGSSSHSSVNTSTRPGCPAPPLPPPLLCVQVGMSKDFSGWVDFDNLPFPSQMLVDYIR